MKDIDIIRAVAEFDGWKFIPSHDDATGKAVPDYWIHGETNIVSWNDSPWSYLTSLDAIVPVVEKLDRGQQDSFENNLWEILPCAENHGPMTEGGEDIIIPRMFTLANATARQRCEALLRTIGKWREE